MKRITGFFLALLALLVAVPALAATPDDAEADLRDRGFYVEPGARRIDEAALSDLIGELGNRGIRLAVAILDEDPAGGATTFADASVDRLGSATVIVLTRSDLVGVASEQFTQAELEAALNMADEAGGDDLSYVTNFAEGLREIVAGDEVEPSATVAPSEGGGAGGLILLLLVVGGLVLVVVLVVRRGNKKRQERVATELEEARGEIQKELDAMANDILDLADVVTTSGSEQAVGYYQQASAVYEASEEEFAKAQDFAALEAYAAKLDLASWQLQAARALAQGEEPPPKPAPQTSARCFFDPTHRGPFESAQIRTAAGSKQVQVCQVDAEKLRNGQVPEARTIRVGNRQVPAPMAPRSRGGGGFNWMDAFSILVGGMGSGVPVRWGGGRRARPPRRATRTSGSATSWPGRTSRSSSRSSGRSASRSSSRSSSRSRSSASRSRSSGSRARTGRRRNR